MKRRNRKFESPRVDLFEQEAPRVTLSAIQSAQLAMLLEALFAEIAAALVNEEAGDEQDHR
jgi:hypothetical protein